MIVSTKNPWEGKMSSTDVIATMATPSVLLLANAMLILSTNQRLQAILHRVQENEAALQDAADDDMVGGVRRELIAHGRRARLAHRALLTLYAAAAMLLVMIVALGASPDWSSARSVALGSAFLGAGLLLVGTALLAAETLIGVGAIDGRIRRVIDSCDTAR